MKGYYTSSGYMGWVDDKGYQLFETEVSYYEWKFENCPGLYIYHEEVPS